MKKYVKTKIRRNSCGAAPSNNSFESQYVRQKKEKKSYKVYRMKLKETSNEERRENSF